MNPMSTITTDPSSASGPFRESHELTPPDSPLAAYIWINPGRMHGEPCFKGTRIPVRALFDHLRAGDGFGKFLDGYEGVSTEQVVAAIDLAARGLLSGLRLL